MLESTQPGSSDKIQQGLQEKKDSGGQGKEEASVIISVCCPSKRSRSHLKENVDQVRGDLPGLVSLNFILGGNGKVQRTLVGSNPTESSQSCCNLQKWEQGHYSLQFNLVSKNNDWSPSEEWFW